MVNGNLFVADDGNSVVREINTSGIISTIAGNNVYAYSGDGGAATSASMKQPVGVSIDCSDGLYISDEAANVIRYVNPAGTISTFAGNGTNGYSGDGGAATAAEIFPNGIDINSSGDIFLAAGAVVREMASGLCATCRSGNIYNSQNTTDDTENVYSSFPNPNSGYLTITQSIAKNNSAELQLIDLFGRSLLSHKLKFENGTCDVDLSSVSSGIYVIEITNDNNKAQKLKVTICK